MTTETLLPTIFTPEAPAETAPSSPFDTPIPAPQNDGQMAELIGAAAFVSQADHRDPNVAMIANEIYGLIGENPFQGQGDHDGGPTRDAAGRFVPSSGKYVPHQAMERERVKRKELQAELREAELKAARAEPADGGRRS